MLTKNLTFIGIKERSVLGKCYIRATTFLKASSSKGGNLISVTLQNIRFDGISVAVLQDADISMHNCIIFNASQDVIQISSNRNNNIFLSNIAVKSCWQVITVESTAELKLNLNSSSLQGTTLDDRWSPSSAISAASVNLTVIINDSQFTNFTNAVNIQSTLYSTVSRNTLEVFGSVFAQNGPQQTQWWNTPLAYILFFGSALYVSNAESIAVINSTFKSNRAQVGGAIYASNFNYFYMYNCSYLKNFASVSGGAVFIDNTDWVSGFSIIRQSSFRDNRASSFFVYEQEQQFRWGYYYTKGSGGALVNYKSQIGVIGCDFVNNTAVAVGGSIILQNAVNRFFLVDSTFIGPSKTKEIPKQGTILYYISYGFMQNVSFISTDSSQNMLNMVSQYGEVQNRPVQIDSSRVQCPLGYNVYIAGTFRRIEELSINAGFLSLQTYCQPCPYNSYSLEFGYSYLETTFEKGYKVHPIKCFQCPFGGRCGHGIQAKDNFWGYKYDLNKSGQVSFISCPYGYCCRRGSCKTYNSCRNTRQGVLCGKCRDGMQENLISSNCIRKDLCQYKVFWVGIIIAGTVYIFVLMYIKELSKVIKILFIWPFTRKMKQRNLQRPLLGEDNKQLNSPWSIKTDNPQKKTSYPENHYSCFSSGLIKIVFFFYQIAVLCKVGEYNMIKDHVLNALSSFVLSVFNLSPEGSHAAEYWCPFVGLTPLTKTLVKGSFPILLLVLAGVIYVLLFMSTSLKSFLFSSSGLSQTTGRAVLTRVQGCILQIIILGYSTLTSSLLSLTTCVSLRNGARIFYMDGSVSCWQWWQYLAWILVGIWVLPFCISLYVSPKLYRQGKSSTTVFLLSLALPPPFVLHFGLQQLPKKFQEKRWSVSYDHLISDNNPAEDNGQNDHSNFDEELLLILEGPFRKQAPSKTYLHWDAVLIFERLVLIVLRAVFVNPVVRLYLMVISIICFLVNHVFVCPFNSRALNLTQTFSLGCLCINGLMNLFHAYVYVNGTPLDGWLLSLSLTFNIVETSIFFIFPGLFCILISLSCTYRLFYLIWWLSKVTLKFLVRCICKV